MFDEYKHPNETVRQTVERVMREKGMWQEPKVMHTEIGDFHYYDDNDDNTDIAGGSATGNTVESAAGTVTAPNTSSLELQSTYTPSPVYGTSASNNYQIQSPSDFASPTTPNTFGSSQLSSSLEQTQFPDYTSSVANGWQINNATSANQNPQNQANHGQNVAWFGEPPAAIRQAIGRYAPDVLAQYSAPTSLGQTAQPKRTVYQSLSGFAQNNEKWYENNHQKNSFNYVRDEYETNPLINDCLKSDRFRQFVSNIKQPGREGYGFHISDQPTNSGISKKWYEQFLAEPKNVIFTQNYPHSVKNLTQEQIDNLYCQGFYKPFHNEIINDDFTSEHIFDIGVNIGKTKGIPIIQNAVNDITNLGISTTGGIGTETVSAINNIPENDLVRFNNQIVDRRREYYDKLNNSKYPGWYPRSELFRR